MANLLNPDAEQKVFLSLYSGSCTSTFHAFQRSNKNDTKQDVEEEKRRQNFLKTERLFLL